MAQPQGSRSPHLDLEVVRRALAAAVSPSADVIAAYIFGSVASGLAGPMSDVDVALLLGGTGDRDELIEQVTDVLARHLRTDRIDVVRLDRVSLPVRYRVLRDGVLVLSRDAAQVERFVADTVRQYLDFKPLRDRALQTVGDASLRG